MRQRNRAKMVSSAYSASVTLTSARSLVTNCSDALVASEIQNLRREAQAFNAVRALLRSGCEDGEPSAARRVFDKARCSCCYHFSRVNKICPKVFTHDVHNLLSMTDMWRSRAPPEPLNYNTIVSTPISDEGATTSTSNGHTTVASALPDQKTLTLREMLDMFISR
jgi:ubiquitin-like 1-activating enzyme E1 B